MYIHVVQPGESLWILSNFYGVSIQQLILDNGLENLPYLHLIPGQSLVISTNEIPSYRKEVEINGYMIPTNPTYDNSMINKIGTYLTYITPSSYVVTSNGNIRPLNDEAILMAAANNDIATLLSITNEGESNFDPALARIIFEDVNLQYILFNNILNVMRAKGYYGLNINFERLYPEDRYLYNEFLRRAVDFFHRYNYLVSTALVPKTYDMTTGEWWGGHDYKAQGEILDFVILMTYDWGCVACPPMAVAPVNEIVKVLDYAVSVIPREKISMGIPFYGFDWSLPFEPGDLATLINYEKALQLASEYDSYIQFDTTAQVPFFYYFDENGTEHVVWFDDARSFQAKYGLIRDYGLRGASYWAINISAPQNWPVLNYMFHTTKLLQ